MSKIALVLLLAAWVAPSTGHAQAEPRAYRGPHPIDLEGHWHLADEAHVHGELTVGLEVFGDVDGVLIFLADPIAYGYAGAVWTYRGAHPLPGGLEAYCGIDGEHAHPFAPEGRFRREPDGVHAFVGALRGGRAMLRPGQMAPRHPIVTAERASTVAGPFWFGGCLHRRTATGLVSPLFGCQPVSAFPAARTRAAPPAVDRAPPPRGYATFEARPGRAPARGPSRVQRR